MKKLKQTTVIAIVIVIIIAIAFGILLSLYLKQNQENRETYIEEKIRILENDSFIGEYTFSELSEITPPEDFQAVYKPNGKLPMEKTYNGIYLKDLLISLDIDLSDKNTAIFTASDGLQKSYSINDILDNDNVYIANKVNGKPFNKGIDALAYTKPEEDGGPYVVIKAKDSISQNRVKLLVEINIK